MMEAGAIFGILLAGLIDGLLRVRAILRTRQQREAWPPRATGIVVDDVGDTF